MAFIHRELLVDFNPRALIAAILNPRREIIGNARSKYD
jgi:hypothetical protein